MRFVTNRLLLLSLLHFAVVPLPALRAQTATPTGPVAPGAAASNVVQIRQMIDRGHSEEALKALDVLAALKPVPEGVERLRGVALIFARAFQ